MKILVFSDSHGCVEPMIETIRCERPDAVFFLGDMVADIDSVIREIKNVAFYVVRGNNDVFSREPDRICVSVGGRTFFATHGHLYRDILSLSLAAKERSADTVLFGHTHRPFNDTENGVSIMNPGSVRDTKTYGVFVEGKEPEIKRM